MGTSAEDDVLFIRKKNAGIVVLNRPKALNAVNYNIVTAMLSKLRAWEEDPDVGIVLVKGTGDKAFCAGGDVVATSKAAKTDKELCRNIFYDEYLLDYKTHVMRKPYVSLVDGIVMGGGVGISVHGRFSVATERTLFAMPETALGLFPDDGGSYFLPRLKGKVGMFLGLTGHRLKGRDVHSVGVATHFVNSQKLPLLEEELCTAKDVSVDGVQAVLDRFHHMSLDTDPREFSLKDHVDVIDNCFAKPTIEGILDDLGKEGSEWSIMQKDILLRMSPTSLKVTLKLLTEGEKLPLDECLKIEYRMSQRFMAEHDFHEGVRAILIDKDRQPVWSPRTLGEVSENTVNSYFLPLGKDEKELDFSSF